MFNLRIHPVRVSEQAPHFVHVNVKICSKMNVLHFLAFSVLIFHAGSLDASGNFAQESIFSGILETYPAKGGILVERNISIVLEERNPLPHEVPVDEECEKPSVVLEENSPSANETEFRAEKTALPQIEDPVCVEKTTVAPVRSFRNVSGEMNIGRPRVVRRLSLESLTPRTRFVSRCGAEM